MINSRPAKMLMILAMTSLVAACKLAVVVVEGGEVQSTHSGTCLEAGICVHQVNDTNYMETFTAVPKSGWVFEKWNSGGGFLCQNSTAPICVISAVGTKGNATIEALIASDSTFYIMPIFVKALQITDIVKIDGSVWAQADLFTSLSWTEINKVCPAPEGLCNGSLNGYDVSGWIWASVDDVIDLLGSLGGPLLNYPTTFAEVSSDWAPAFYNAGFRKTFESAGRAFIAWTSSFDGGCKLEPKGDCGVDVQIVDRTDSSTSDLAILQPFYASLSLESRGVWLYKNQLSIP